MHSGICQVTLLLPRCDRDYRQGKSTLSLCVCVCVWHHSQGHTSAQSHSQTITTHTVHQIEGGEKDTYLYVLQGSKEKASSEGKGANPVDKSTPFTIYSHPLYPFFFISFSLHSLSGPIWLPPHRGQVGGSF